MSCPVHLIMHAKILDCTVIDLPFLSSVRPGFVFVGRVRSGLVRLQFVKRGLEEERNANIGINS